MTHRNEKILTAGIAVIVLAGAVVGYTVVLPNILATRYLSRVHKMAASMSVVYEKMFESTESPFLSDFDVSVVVRTDNVQTINRLIKESRDDLGTLDKASDDMLVLPYSFNTRQHKAALVLRERVKAFVQQSTTALDEYEKLIVSLQVYNESIRSMKVYIDDFNNISDINIYAGRSAEVRLIASELSRRVDEFEKQTTSEELAVNKAVAIQAFRQAVNGFNNLADGLDAAVDSAIYSAVSEIEDAAKQLELNDQAGYAKTVQSSRIVKNVRELVEKLDFVLP